MNPPVASARSHTAVAALSFVVAVVLLGIKFWAFAVTDSQAIFSDALESIVNVFAAGVAFASRFDSVRFLALDRSRSGLFHPHHAEPSASRQSSSGGASLPT